MRNKLLLALLVLFVSVSIIGCGKDNAAKPKNLKTKLTTNGKYVILTWEVKGTNVDDCIVYMRESNQKTVVHAAITPAPADWKVTYDAALNETVNKDVTKWSAVATIDFGGFGLDSINGMKVNFGVRTVSWAGATISDMSNIVWDKEEYTLKK